MRRKIIYLLLIFVLVMAVIPLQAAIAQTAQPGHYFTESSHWSRGEFYLRWSSVMNATMLYGYPITEEIDNPLVPGGKKQYYQRALFTFDPSKPAGYQVNVEPIGLTLFSLANYKVLSAPSMSRNHPACLFDRSTEKLICYAFKEFYLANGGVSAFGRPVSDIVVVNERLVQYFERARFEWHPDMPAGQRVVLGNIGYELFDLYEDRGLSAPVPDLDLGSAILSLGVRITPDKATTYGTDKQVIFVIVQDQQLRLVSNARVDMVATLPSGDTVRTLATTTDGVAKISFDYKGETRGIVKITVTVEIDGKKATTWYSYRIW